MLSVQKTVEKLFQIVMSDPRYNNEINYLQNKFKISRQEIIKTWIFWDTAIREYSNDIYSSNTLRLVMYLHNCLHGSWHEKRQNIVSDYLVSIKPTSICEIGFGVPQQYVKRYLQSEVKILLADYEQTSLDFASILLLYWDKDWNKTVETMIHNLDFNPLPSGYDVYLFQDCIEHASNPSETLKKYVDSCPIGTSFIFSLPIEVENPIPEHHIYWHDINQLKKWIQSFHLKIIVSKPILMNNNVDIFARSLHRNFREVVLLTKKL